MFARTRQHQANDASFLQQRVNLMLAISSLVERGRLFFPNIDPTSKGCGERGRVSRLAPADFGCADVCLLRDRSADTPRWSDG